MESYIGQSYLPLDNSYAVCISNPREDSRLAGNYNTAPTKCTIISEPFVISVHSPGIPAREHTVILVNDPDNKTHCVLFSPKCVVLTNSDMIRELSERMSIKQERLSSIYAPFKWLPSSFIYDPIISSTL